MHKQAVADLKYIHQHIERLPLLPNVLFELMTHDQNDEKYYEMVLGLAKADPPLASFIISYANSASSSPNHAITNLKAALTRVGALRVVNLLTAKSVAKVFVPKTDDSKQLWRHSIQVATFSSFLCRTAPTFTVNPETAYLAGLFHDLGRFVMMDIVPDALEATVASSWATPQEHPEVETATLGYNHCEVGYLACRRWRMPELICNTTRHHHHYTVCNNAKLPKEFRELIILMTFTDHVSALLAKHPDWEDWTNEKLYDYVQVNCLRPEIVSASLPIKIFVDALPALYQKCQQLLESIGQ